MYPAHIMRSNGELFVVVIRIAGITRVGVCSTVAVQQFGVFPAYDERTHFRIGELARSSTSAWLE